jgi:hypothetical protein
MQRENQIETRRGLRLPNVLMASEPGAAGKQVFLGLLCRLLAEVRPLFVPGRAYRLRADDLSDESTCHVNLAAEEAGGVQDTERVVCGVDSPDLAARLLPGEPLLVRF